MRFLIDGYNLMHFLGLVRPRAPKSLERSRLELQAWVRNAHGSRVGDVTLVFDGTRFEGKHGDRQTDHGLCVRFSQGEPADDLIDDLIRDEHQPKQLTVVSNDRRVQESGRRRQCIAWSCGEYIDWLMEGGHQPPKPPREPEKPIDNDEERARWLKEFADIDQDPEVKKFNRMYRDFGDQR